MDKRQYLILHTEPLKIETFEPRKRLQQVLDSVPARVQEARRVMKEIREEFQRSQQLETSSVPQAHMRPIVVDLSVLLGEQWQLTERFKTFMNPQNGHLSLNLLPLVDTLDVSSQILGLTLSKQSHRSHIITGGMGIGKSHAVLLVLIDALATLDYAGIWIAFNPLNWINSSGDLGKQRFVEQLLVLMHRFDHEELLDVLEPFYGGKSFKTPQQFAGKVLLACRRFCEKQGKRFIHIIDEENIPYRQGRNPLAAAFADDFFAGTYADFSIYISSATSSEVIEYFSSKSVEFALHEVTRNVVQTGNNTAGLFYTFRDHSLLPTNQREGLLAWQNHFGGE